MRSAGRCLPGRRFVAAPGRPDVPGRWRDVGTASRGVQAVRRAEFMRAAAHDMKNPLGVALSDMHMLQDYYGNSDPTAMEITRLALNGINRLQSLINDLLNLEQIESGLGITKGEFKLGDLIRELFEEMKPILIEKKLTYKLDISENIPNIPGDQKWVRRAILNYVDNAAKYINDGGQSGSY